MNDAETYGERKRKIIGRKERRAKRRKRERWRERKLKRGFVILWL